MSIIPGGGGLIEAIIVMFILSCKACPRVNRGPIFVEVRHTEIYMYFFALSDSFIYAVRCNSLYFHEFINNVSRIKAKIARCVRSYFFKEFFMLN